MFKAILSIDTAHSNRLEKIYVITLLSLSVLISLFVTLFITFDLAPMVAVKQWQFYRAVFIGVLLLCMLPYVIAYLLGRLLSGIARLLKDNKVYNTQYSLMLLLFTFFTYGFVMAALSKQTVIHYFYQKCLKQQQSQANHNCKSKAITVYGLLNSCRIGSDKNSAACKQLGLP